MQTTRNLAAAAANPVRCGAGPRHCVCSDGPAFVRQALAFLKPGL